MNFVRNISNNGFLRGGDKSSSNSSGFGSVALKLAAIFGALMIAGFFVACEKRGVSLDDIAKRDELVVGVFGDKPPFGYIDAQGQNAGFDVYIAKRMGADMLEDKAVFGDKVRFIIVEAANRIEFLRSNKVDVMMANFTMTKERQEQVDFSLPYMKVALGVVSKDGAIRDVSELAGKTLIVNKGTTADFYFTKNHPEIKLLKFEQNTETFAALKDGRGDALAHDNTLLFAWAKENPAFKVGIKKLGDDDVIAAAVKKGNKELLEWINAWMEAARQEGFFTEAYDKTLANTFGDDVRAQDVVFVK